MKNLLSILLLALCLSLSAQIKLDPSYTYIKDGKNIGYNKGVKLLQSGDFVADISDATKTVTIKESPSLEAGDRFPFELMTDLDGNTIDPKNLIGKIVVVNFWFTGCRPCIMEMPELNEMVKKFKPEEVVFLAFANEIAPRVSMFLEKHSFDYTIIPDQMTETLAKGITAFPTHFIVNREGIISERLTGFSEGIGEKLTNKIEKLL
jgi:thiol-disulfide isomerase/thioredoxin